MCGCTFSRWIAGRMPSARAAIRYRTACNEHSDPSIGTSTDFIQPPVKSRTLSPSSDRGRAIMRCAVAPRCETDYRHDRVAERCDRLAGGAVDAIFFELGK